MDDQQEGSWDILKYVVENSNNTVINNIVILII